MARPSNDLWRLSEVPRADHLALLHAKFRRMADVPAAEWAAVQGRFRRVTLKKRQLLTDIGSTQLLAGLILSGLVRAYYRSRTGTEYILNFLEKDDIAMAFGAALRGAPSTLAIEALEPTELLCVEYGEWRTMMSRHQCWQEIGRKLAEQNYEVRERHYFELLTMTGIERYENFKRTYPHLSAVIAQKHIASFLGLTPVSFNRLIAARRRGQVPVKPPAAAQG